MASITDRRTQIVHRKQASILHNAALGFPFPRCCAFPIEGPVNGIPLSLPHYLEPNILDVTWSPNHVRTIGSTARRAYLAPGWFREPKFEKDHRSSISCPTRTFDTLSICISSSSPAYSYVTSVGDLLISTAVNVRLCDDGAKSE
jgi:hypothetical protein